MLSCGDDAAFTIATPTGLPKKLMIDDAPAFLTGSGLLLPLPAGLLSDLSDCLGSQAASLLSALPSLTLTGFSSIFLRSFSLSFSSRWPCFLRSASSLVSSFSRSFFSFSSSLRYLSLIASRFLSSLAVDLLLLEDSSVISASINFMRSHNATSILR